MTHDDPLESIREPVATHSSNLRYITDFPQEPAAKEGISTGTRGNSGGDHGKPRTRSRNCHGVWSGALSWDYDEGASSTGYKGMEIVEASLML